MNVHIYPSDLSNASRIEKIARSLEKFGFFDQIFLVGCGDRMNQKHRRLSAVIQIKLFGRPNKPAGTAVKILRFIGWYWEVYRFFSNRSLTCVNAHSLSCLPLCVLLKKKTQCVLIYDTHELETETTESKGLRQKLAKIVEAKLIKYVDHVVVVSESIALHYASSYRIPKPSVILNAPVVTPLTRTNLLREELGIPNSSVIFIYLGVAGPGRGITELVRVFRQRGDNRAVLVVMGYGPLSDMLAAEAEQCGNLFFKDAVPPSEVVRYTSSADIGVALIEPVCLSYEYCLPNKLFEYGMAGLPCLVSDVTEMRRYVETNRCGYVTQPGSPELVNATLDEILAQDRDAVSVASYQAATRHAWDVQEDRLYAIYNSLIEKPTRKSH